MSLNPSAHLCWASYAVAGELDASWPWGAATSSFPSSYVWWTHSKEAPLKKWFQVTTSHISKVWFLWCTTKFLQIHPLDCESLEFFRFSTKKTWGWHEKLQGVYPNDLASKSPVGGFFSCPDGLCQDLIDGLGLKHPVVEPPTAFFPISADLSPLVKPQDIYGCFRK